MIRYTPYINLKARASARGFTLLELIVTTSIFAVVIVTCFAAFRAGIFGYNDIERNIKVSLAAAKILNGIDADIRNAFKYSDTRLRFEGDSSSVTFVTLVDSYRKDAQVREMALVSYSIVNKRISRLLRKGADSLNAKSSEKAVDMVTDVNAERLAFLYGYIDSATGKILFKNAWNQNPQLETELPRFVNVETTLADKSGRIRKDYARTIFLPV